MVALRTLSERPTVLVDDRGHGLAGLPAPGQIGPPGTNPLGRNRLVSTLPLNKSGHITQLEPLGALVDDRGFLFGDPSGNVIGTPALFVHRLVAATRTPQTRR